MKPLIRRWTEEEIERLKVLASQGASVVRCSSALNRSSSSITKTARALGLSLAGTRIMKAKHRDRIEEAERDLPKGARRNDGTYV